MSFDYVSLREQNKLRYGTDIGRIGRMLLADRYDDRTHFVYELLQNAEDALARRSGEGGSRAVHFELSPTELRFSHFGVPFTPQDVEGICGIGESTKQENLTAIGRFGIGFKSVYAYTDRPEVHSGDEHFTVESYVWPIQISPRNEGSFAETVFIFPFKNGDSKSLAEITEGLQKLGPRVLLFLSEIDEISWSVRDGLSGRYLRDKPELLSEDARKVVLIGQEQGGHVTEESWMIFSEKVRTEANVEAGKVEVAFALQEDENGSRIKAVENSNIVVFFPTVVPTHLGFLVQGPYRTTPSRDNVPRSDTWNRHLVDKTGALLIKALRRLRELNLLDVTVLQTLPLERSKFGMNNLFSPLFDAVANALQNEPLLPRWRGGYVSGRAAHLARTQELRELLDHAQLADLLQRGEESAWLNQGITQANTSLLRDYLIQELKVVEVAPETILPRLSETFLESQSDPWIMKLYEFLSGQAALVRQRRLDKIPLARLQSGIHVTAKKEGQPQAFLPSSITTDFPTVRATVCTSSTALSFLRALGLDKPNPVDDVIRNVLPKYSGDMSRISEEEYASDIGRFLQAFATDSVAQRAGLMEALREGKFVKAIDLGDGSKSWKLPRETYLSTQRLSELFEGVSGVYLIDESSPCLHGKEIRELLVACGVARSLQTVSVDTQFGYDELAQMRLAAGWARSTGGDEIKDVTLQGLDQLLAQIRSLNSAQAVKKAELLWDALRDIENRLGQSAFHGTYHWFFSQQRNHLFDAAWVRQLNEVSWIPGRDGTLQAPHSILFEETGWAENAFLLSKITFKPPIIAALAREAGIEPGALDLILKHGVTEAKLKDLLGISDINSSVGSMNTSLTQGADRARRTEIAIPNEISQGTDRGSTSGTGSEETSISSQREKSQSRGETNTAKGTKTSFVSYIAVDSNEVTDDPDGLEHEARMALEESAIQLILSQEPELERTPTNNPGFDLSGSSDGGETVKWVEVKAISSDFDSRPVTLSKTQFEWAQQNGSDFWLYVVENAASQESARIIRIQDPAGQARTFTFDCGWLRVADQI